MRFRLPINWRKHWGWARTYPVTAGFLTVYIGFYVATAVVQGGFTQYRRDIEFFPINIGTLLDFGALTTRALGPSAEPWRLVTATLLHAGLVHLFFNGFALFQIGTWIEDWFGGSVLLTLHFLFGLAGNVVSILFHGRDPQFAQVGASGAIFGLIAFMAVVSRQSKHSTSQGAFAILFGWIVASLALGWAIGADNAAHLGGAFAGTFASLFAFVFRPGLMPKGALRLSGLLSTGVFVLAFGLQARVGIPSHRARIEARRIHRRMVERANLNAFDLQLQTLDSLRRGNPLAFENPAIRTQIARELQAARGNDVFDDSTRKLAGQYLEAIGGKDGAVWQTAKGLNDLDRLRDVHESWATVQGLRIPPHGAGMR